MPAIQKPSVCLVMSFLGLMVTSSSVVSPQDAKRSNPLVKDLKAKRLEALESANSGVKVVFRNFRPEDLIVAVASAAFEARIEEAKTREERIEVCKQAIEEAEGLLESTTARTKGARGTKLHVVLDQAYLLELQIRLENLIANE